MAAGKELGKVVGILREGAKIFASRGPWVFTRGAVVLGGWLLPTGTCVPGTDRPLTQITCGIATQTGVREAHLSHTWAAVSSTAKKLDFLAPPRRQRLCVPGFILWPSPECEATRQGVVFLAHHY